MGDAALCLPSHFLAGHGHDIKNNCKSVDFDATFAFPSEFPYEFGMSSPAVESSAGSTEAESSDGEEDFFAGLTRRLSLSSLNETRKQLSAMPIKPDHATFSEIPRKTQGLVGSPQSTLSGIGSWSGGSAGSGDGSPNGYSRVPSPSTTQFDENNDPWEVIYAAAGQVARWKMNNSHVSQFDVQNSRGLLTHSRPNQSFSQVNQFVRPKQQCGSVWGRPTRPNWSGQQQQVQVQNRAREFGHESVNVKCTRPLCLPQSAWPSPQVQQQNSRVQFAGSGSRAAVPGAGGSSVKRVCGGTGVFLPRHYETPSESRKKTGCAPPVLLPAKVVHALNLNIDDLNGASQQRFSNAFASDYDAIIARRKALLMQQRLSFRREEATNYEIRLPQDSRNNDNKIKAGRFLLRYYGYGDDDTDGAKAQVKERIGREDLGERIDCDCIELNLIEGRGSGGDMIAVMDLYVRYLVGF
ncbi:unnamed protein product [Sphenostylis stenocarpa]|uniref:Uncharacterized protein n=1 Tax=Sphenostylis stenocarpa TaxID=92480 RepID=A0AA86RPE6_9FABA|nr:unnamed protein product [Sphenostylis stenocarpa]